MIRADCGICCKSVPLYKLARHYQDHNHKEEKGGSEMEELETKEESDRDKRRARLRKKLETRKRKAEETQEKRNKKIKTIDKDDEAEEKEEVEEVEKEKAEDKEEAFYVIPKSGRESTAKYGKERFWWILAVESIIPSGFATWC